MARTTSTTIMSNFLLAILVTGAFSTPRGNEAKNKKLLRNDHAESWRAIALEVEARGATVAQHQTELHAEPNEQVGYSVGKLPGKLQPADNGDDREEKTAAKVAESKVSSAENDVHDNAGVATCEGSDTDAGKVDCMKHNKCGNNEDTDWMIQCGYGTLSAVSGVCVLKSKDEGFRKERCAVLGDGGKSGRLFCHEDELYVNCVDGKGLDFDLDAVVTHAVPNTAATKSATTSTGGNQEIVVDAINQAEALSDERVTKEEIHHSMGTIDVFANMIRDSDIPYVMDTEEDAVCKSIENITFNQDGTIYSISYAGDPQDDGSTGAKDKKCKVSTFIPADDDPESDSFTHGRLKLCAEYVAQAHSSICGDGRFWMTKDYHCYCSTGDNCEIVQEEDACLYELNEITRAEGAEATMEQLQGEYNHIRAVEAAIQKDHELHPEGERKKDRKADRKADGKNGGQ